jgi:hypothetical protein
MTKEGGAKAGNPFTSLNRASCAGEDPRICCSQTDSRVKPGNSPLIVIPAKAGIQLHFAVSPKLDPGLRRGDECREMAGSKAVRLDAHNRR